MRVLPFSLLFPLLVAPASAQDICLRLPVACEIGKTCFIQHYVDRDPSPAAQDYQCGTLTYEGHDGTDIRIPTMAAQKAGVNVLAAADGKVLRVRDGVRGRVDRGPRPRRASTTSNAATARWSIMAEAGKPSIATWPRAASR